MKARRSFAPALQPEFLHDLGKLRAEAHMTRTEVIEVALRLLDNARRDDEMRQARLQTIEM